MSTYCTKFEVETRLKLGAVPVRSSFVLVGSSFQLGRSETVPYLLVALLVAVLLNE